MGYVLLAWNLQYFYSWEISKERWTEIIFTDMQISETLQLCYSLNLSEIDLHNPKTFLKH